MASQICLERLCPCNRLAINQMALPYTLIARRYPFLELDFSIFIRRYLSFVRGPDDFCLGYALRPEFLAEIVDLIHASGYLLNRLPLSKSFFQSFLKHPGRAIFNDRRDKLRS